MVDHSENRRSRLLYRSIGGSLPSQRLFSPKVPKGSTVHLLQGRGCKCSRLAYQRAAQYSRLDMVHMLLNVRTVSSRQTETWFKAPFLWPKKTVFLPWLAYSSVTVREEQITAPMNVASIPQPS
jgi:hypothetical protein